MSGVQQTAYMSLSSTESDTVLEREMSDAAKANVAPAVAALELTPQHGSEMVYAAAFSRDGKRFFTADTNAKKVRMWESSTNEMVREFTIEGHGRIFGLAVSPDGTKVASADYDGEGGPAAYTFDVETGNLLQKFQGGSEKQNTHTCKHTGGVWAVAFSPDGKSLLTGAWDSKAIIWDVATADWKCELVGHSARVMGVAYSPNGKMIATASSDCSVRTWEPETGDPLHFYPVTNGTPTPSFLNAIAFAPDGASMAACSDNGVTTVFSVPYDRTIRSQVACELKPKGKKENGVKAEPSKVLAVAYSADSRSVGTTHEDGLVRIWDLALGEVVQILKGHGYRHDKEAVIKEVVEKRWKTAAAAAGIKPHLHALAKVAVKKAGQDDVWSIAFAPNDDRVLTGGADKTARIWHTKRNGVCFQTFQKHTKNVASVAASPDGSCFVSTSFDKTVKLWDMSGDLRSSQSVDGDPLSSAFAPDGQTFVTGGYDKCATVWNASTGEKEMKLETSKDTDSRIFCVDYSPDSRFIATAHADKKVRIWGTEGEDQGKIVKELEGDHEGFCVCAQYSPNGKSILTGCWGRKDSTGRIWDVESETCQVELKGHGGNLKCCAWSPDGQFAITGSEDKTARVWNAETGECLKVLNGHTANVMDVKLAPTEVPGKFQAISGGFEGDIRCWNVETGACERVLSLSGPATSISFGKPGDLRLLSSSGDAVVGLDFSATDSPMVSAQDLLWLTILPDMKDKKSERTKRLCDRLSGVKKANSAYDPVNKQIDFSSCLLQRIGEHGETALHMALDKGNFELANVLTNDALGGKTALVVSMDDHHLTPWSIALSHLCFDAKREINHMSIPDLKAGLRKRHFSKKEVADMISDNDEEKTKKLMRGALKVYGSINKYRELCDPMGDYPLDFEGCLRARDSGVLHAVALSRVSDNRKPHDIIWHESLLGCLLEHSERARSKKEQYKIFNAPIAVALINHSWTKYAKTRVHKEAYWYALLVLCFTVAAVVTQDACLSAHAQNVTQLDDERTFDLKVSVGTNLVASAMTQLLLLRLIYRDVLQLYHQGWAYFGDAWNSAQVVSYVLGFASTVYHSRDVVLLWYENEQPDTPVNCYDREQHRRELHAVAGGTVWLGLLFYMRGFDQTQTAVPIIRQICVDVYPYLIVLSTILVGCAFIFMNLLHIDALDTDIAKRYTSPSRAFLSSFTMMLGSFDVEDFTPDPRGESVIVFILFMVFVQLVLLNMLIAIMGESVMTVSAQKKEAGLHAKAELIKDSWDFMSDAELTDEKHFPSSFPLAKVKKTKFKSTQDVMKKNLPNVQNSMKQSVTDLGETVNSKVQAVDDKLERVIEEQARTQKQLDRIVTMLMQSDPSRRISE